MVDLERHQQLTGHQQVAPGVALVMALKAMAQRLMAVAQ
jgi:hypothetical protein